MDVNEQHKLRRNCSINGCSHLALNHSEPPRCPAHVENLDVWFDKVLSETVAPEVPETARDISYALFAHDMYQNLLLNNPLGQGLYADFKNRVDPRNEVSFSFGDVVYFALIAAASGIIGNFAYDVIKALVKKLDTKHNSPKLEKTFEQVVRQTKYEELRVQYHPDGSCNVKATSELKTELETRHRLVMWKDFRDG